MKIFQKAVAFLLLLSLTAGILSGCASKELLPPEREETVDLTQGFTQAPSKGELTKVSENERFILYVNFANGEAAVEDKRNKITWYSNPVDKSDDGLASGFNKNALQSVVTVSYTTALSVDMTCGGFMSSVRKDGMSYRVEPDGSVIFLFDFPNEEFRIPIRYGLEEDSFTAEILTDGVWEYGTNTIKTIDLLPFFGAGGREDQGYMLVPDGSGALIYYNNERLTAKTFSKNIYGFDNGTNDKVMGGMASAAYFNLSENQYLPVFGVSRNDQGFLAVITEGASRADINANVAKKYTLYNTVWTSYHYHSVGTVRQTQKDGSETATSVAEKKLEQWQNYQVRFFFLDRGENTYSHMAARYREYLIQYEGLEVGVEEQAGIPLYLDLYGYITKRKSFLGIPVDAKIPMTTVEDANTILDLLYQADISNVVLKYNDWAKNSYFGKLPTKAKVDGKVGSSKELLALQDRLEENGGKLFLSADLLNVYKTGNGISSYTDVLRNVANTAQRQFQFSLASAAIDSRYDAWYLLRPSAVSGTFRKFADNMTGAGYRNLSLDSVGKMLYSELGSSGVGRNQMVRVMEDGIQTVASGAESLMVTGANDYAADQADHILRTPSKSSGYDLEDVSVPFYQMVFHGYVSYSLGAANLTSDPGNMTLKCLEYGAAPLFSLIYRNGDELIGSRMDSLYSADFTNWSEFITGQYRVLNRALSLVQTGTITDHRILSKDVRAVEYSCGVTIYVNYGKQPVSAEGITLEAEGFAVMQNGELVLSGRVEN